MDGNIDFKSDNISSRFNLITKQGLIKSDLNIYNFFQY